MLPSLLLLVVVGLIVREVVRLPEALKLVGAALLLGLPVLGGVVLFAIAKGSPSMTAQRDAYAFAGTLGGWIAGTVALHLVRRG